MDWITRSIAIGRFDELPPSGAAVLDLRAIPDHCWISGEAFSEAVGFIHASVLKGEKVYVHCIGGISRSPTIVAAYLAARSNLTASQAIDFVRSKRPEIMPHAEQLRSLSAWLESRLACA